ncbi:MAG: TonB-dependent receptor, partial [Acidobacteria bacterium]|nr:TonB-dependent receptor [Acidobacteriota bacterium]
MGFGKRALCVFALVLLAGLLLGQEFRATLSGRVLDPSGAAVPGARIQAVNTANNETATAATDTSGAYTVPFLRPGVYRMNVTAQGFKAYNRENITLQVGQIAGIDVTLEVGEVTESVQVTAEVALLETQTASRSGIVDTRQVLDLPLNTRNPFMLGAMMSGVTFRGAAIWQRPFDNGAIAEWSVNGGRNSNNEFLMDGAPNNGQAGGNNIAYVPIVDAVQEFSVQTNSYDSQYGHTGGGVFNVVLKSGTSSHHITGWEFMRRKSWDANTFQNNSIGAARPGHKLDQFGFQLDGPAQIPGLFRKDGAVKLFYLGSFESYHELWPQFLRNSFPEPEMRNGDFSKLVTSDGRPITIYNPFDYTMDAANNPTRRPFAGNMIPGSMIHPVARAVTRYMPAPNAKTPATRYSTQNLLHPEYPANDDFYNLILKFDWNFGDKHRAFIRHASNDRTEDRCTNGVCEGPGQAGQQPFQRINDAYVADWVGTITPTLVLNARLSHNRFIEKGFGRGNVGFDLTSLGLPASLVSQLPGPTYFGLWQFAGYSSLGRYQSINITNNYGLMGNVTKIWGAHTVKMGVDIRRIHYITQNSGNILNFAAAVGCTQRLWNQGEADAGDGYASFLLGSPPGSVNYPLYPFFRQWYMAPYIQNDWKATRRLTLNLGLRWDYNGPPDEKYNRLNRGFNPTVASPVAAQIPAAMLTQYPSLRNLKGGLSFAGVDGQPRIVSKRDFANWQPRVGAAFQITSKLVMRAGYGLNFLNPNNNYLQTAGFSTSTPIQNSLDGGRTRIPNVLGNPLPGGINVPTGASRGAATFVGQNTSWFNENFWTPYVKQFSFGFQYQLTNRGTLEASYVGTRTVGANSEKAYNIPSLDFRKQCNLLEGGNPAYCDAGLPNPFRDVPAFAGTGFYTSTTLSRYQLNRRFPHFSGDMTELGRNDSNFWYNSLQVNYNHRMSRGLTLLTNYTLSKQVERWGFNDAFANVQQQGLYFLDRTHIFKLTAVYDLPFGKGQRWGSGATGAVQKLIGGWEFNAFYNDSSGEPLDLPGNVIMLKDPRVTPDWKAHQVRFWSPCVLRQYNDGSIRPQQFSLDRGCGTDFANYAWLMTASYAPRATSYRSGQLRAHSAFTLDFSLNKTTYIGERARVQIGIEAFNAFNHNYFGRERGTTDPNNPNFGTLFPNQA